MRFFLPDWDDFVDTAYDFEHDIPSAVRPVNRDRAYIWDLFNQANVPIDGVLYSRRHVESSSVLGMADNQQVESGSAGVDQLVPDWLTTICDSGAWGYRSLPFPPYDPVGMLDFYEELGVTAGVTVDHLILGTGTTECLYLDERALPESFTVEMMHETVRERVDIISAPWPDEWPAYVTSFNDTITGTVGVKNLDESLLAQPYSMLLPDVETHRHAVYRRDDATIRQQLSHQNAEVAMEQYADGDYSFRLLGAIQGRDLASYARMTDQILDCGFDYIGIGGVAGSTKQTVNDIVRKIGARVAASEQARETRIDTHLFGFAKLAAFETIGRSRIASYDSASPMRAAWTGGRNYHLPGTGEYDAIRVRYPDRDMSLRDTIERTLRGQELLCALRAYDDVSSVTSRIESWRAETMTAINELVPYLRGHKHDVGYQQDRLNTLLSHFQAHYPYADVLSRSFGQNFVKHLLKLLRQDTATNPLDFEKYMAVIKTAEAVFDETIPQRSGGTCTATNDTDQGHFETTWVVVKRYTEAVGDENLLPGYRELLIDQPWQICECPICADLGIDVVIFRGANRNKRRGYHNTYQLYKQSEAELPSIAVLTRGSPALSAFDTVEGFLKSEREGVWNAVHDLPIIEIGVLTAAGMHEWWESAPSTVSFDPVDMEDVVSTLANRYDDIYVDSANWSLPAELESMIGDRDCRLRRTPSSHVLRSALMRRMGYEEDFVPDQPSSLPLLAEGRRSQDFLDNSI